MRRRWMIGMLGAAVYILGVAQPASSSETAVVERRETVTVAPATTAVVVATINVAPSLPASTVASGGVGPLTSTVAPTPADSATTTQGETPKDRFATTIAFIGILVAVAIVAALAIRSAYNARHSSGAP